MVRECSVCGEGVEGERWEEVRKWRVCVCVCVCVCVVGDGGEGSSRL